MTKVLISIYRTSCYYEAEGHAGNHDVCTILSTLEGVLTTAQTPRQYDAESGHCQIVIDDATDAQKTVFRAVQSVLQQVAEQFPEHVKLY